MRLLAMFIGVLGCATKEQYQIAHSSTLPWAKPDYVQTEFARDRYACLQEATSKAKKDDCDHHFLWLRCDQASAPAMFKACMEARGYTLRE